MAKLGHWLVNGWCAGAVARIQQWWAGGASANVGRGLGARVRARWVRTVSWLCDRSNLVDRVLGGDSWRYAAAERILIRAYDARVSRVTTGVGVLIVEIYPQRIETLCFDKDSKLIGRKLSEFCGGEPVLLEYSNPLEHGDDEAVAFFSDLTGRPVFAEWDQFFSYANGPELETSRSLLTDGITSIIVGGASGSDVGDLGANG